MSLCCCRPQSSYIHQSLQNLPRSNIELGQLGASSFAWYTNWRSFTADYICCLLYIVSLGSLQSYTCTLQEQHWQSSILDVRCSKPSKLISALLIKTRQTQTYNCRLQIRDCIYTTLRGGQACSQNTRLNYVWVTKKFMIKSDNQQNESERITSHHIIFCTHDLLSPLYLSGHPYTLSVKNVVSEMFYSQHLMMNE